MLKKAVLLALAGALAAPPVVAQEASLDDVLSSYYEAIGGLDAWRGVQSMRATGRMMLMPGTEAPFTMTAKRPKKLRIEFTFQGMTGVQAYDGETAWMIMPFMGKLDPEVMPDEDAKDIVEQADLDGVLVDYEADGHQVEYLGIEEVEGTTAHKLKVTLKGGDVQFHYLDAEYYVPIKLEGTRQVRGTTIEFESILSDYKEVDGLVVAHSIEAKPKGAPSGQVITIDQVEVNIDVDDQLFVMPEKTEGEGQQ